MYGVFETNPLEVDGSQYHLQFAKSRTVYWTEKGLRVTRLRLLSDPGYGMYDVSYSHGIIYGEELVRVQYPFSELPKRNLLKAIVKYARQDKVYAKGIGVFDAISILN